MIKSFFVIQSFFTIVWGEGGAVMIVSFRNCIVHSIGTGSSYYHSVFIGANPGSFNGGRGA